MIAARTLCCLLVLHSCSLAPVGAEPIQLFEDPGFERGFVLSASSTSVLPLEIGMLLPPGGPSTKPAWRLDQWGTRQLLLPGPWTGCTGNLAKRVEWQIGSENRGRLLLQVNGEVEYPERPRRQGEPWAHLLVEQKFPRAIALSEWESLDFELSFRVEDCAPVFAPETLPDPGLHTAQISAYWTVETGGDGNPGRRDMFWFGLPMFDARYEIPPGNAALDSGQPNASGKFIFVPEGARFYDTPTGDGDWHRIATDLLPLIEEAFETARNRGYLEGAVRGDCRLSSFNLGWELPGTYRAGIVLRDLSFKGNRK